MTLAIARYNCGGISDLAEKYCQEKDYCWPEIRGKIGPGKEACRGSLPGDQTVSETLNYVEKVLDFMSYYQAHPECYNMPKYC